MQELEKILEEIKQEKLKHWDSSERLNTDKLIGWCFDKCTDIIRKHLNDGWIPADDVLPEDDVEVLVTYSDIDDVQYTDIAITTYGYAHFGGKKLDFKEWRSPFEYFRSNYKVIAWQPLPESYCPERSDNHNGE